MSKSVKLKKGFTINLAGQANQVLADLPQPDTFAVKPDDFVGMLRPKTLVEVGENVKAGTPILIDKKKELVNYSAPVSGEIVEVKRGEKRKLLEIVILADKEIEYESFKTFNQTELSSAGREELQAIMLKSGVWPHLIQRPYGIVANPEDTARDIFISGFDSSPLAPDYNFILKGEEKNFQAGVEVLRKFTSGSIHLGIDAKAEVNNVYTAAENIQINKFSGKHPAGNVGVQIHHIAPVNKEEVVWTISPIGVVQIGRLFLQGRYDTSKIIAVAGSEVKQPQYYRTYSGAAIKRFIDGNVKEGHLRLISGNVLTGRRIDEKGHLGFYDNLVTVIPEGDKVELLGWLLPTMKKLSFSRAAGLLSFMNSPKKEYVLDSNMQGGHRSFVMTGQFEKVVPMDIYPTYLLKAILAEDFDEMEALGIYEIIEEDFALCEFIDVSKHNIQSIVRDGLNLMQYS